MVIVPEMQALRDYLTENRISWYDLSEDSEFPGMPNLSQYMCRTHFTINDQYISVINGSFSYGGVSIYDNENKGLLELWADKVNNGQPLGYLTAEDVIKIIEELKKEGAKK